MAPPEWAYNVDHYVTPPDEELICCICHNVLCDPVRSRCDHVFCRACILKWLENNRSCPMCRYPATPYCLQKVVPLLKNLIAKLKIRCHNSLRNCEAVFSVDQAEAHQKECPFEIVRCKNSPCKLLFLRSDVKNHETNHCLHRFVQCIACNFRVPFLRWFKHVCIDDLNKAIQSKNEAQKTNEMTIKKQEQTIQKLLEELQRLRQQYGCTSPTVDHGYANKKAFLTNAILKSSTYFTNLNEAQSSFQQNCSSSNTSNSESEQASIPPGKYFRGQYFRPESKSKNSLESSSSVRTRNQSNDNVKQDISSNLSSDLIVDTFLQNPHVNDPRLLVQQSTESTATSSSAQVEQSAGQSGTSSTVQVERSADQITLQLEQLTESIEFDASVRFEQLTMPVVNNPNVMLGQSIEPGETDSNAQFEQLRESVPINPILQSELFSDPIEVDLRFL